MRDMRGDRLSCVRACCAVSAAQVDGLEVEASKASVNNMVQSIFNSRGAMRCTRSLPQLRSLRRRAHPLSPVKVRARD